MFNLLEAFSCCSDDLVLDRSSNLNLSENPLPETISISNELIALKFRIRELEQKHENLQKIKSQRPLNLVEKVRKISEFYY
jgi:hypothetical protein